MTTEQQPIIKLELTDEQVKLLGTSIGKEIVRSFSAKQEYLHNSADWLSKLTKMLGETIVSNVASQLEYSPQNYKRIVDIVSDSLVRHITYYEKALSQLGYKIWGAKK